MYPLPLCADESYATREDLDHLAGRYSMLNIKLDKTGGLTEALALARAAREAGFELMTGNMIGTSLAMAPASLLAPWCRFMDLDSALLLQHARESGMLLKEDLLEPPRSELLGSAHAG
jgi:L-alanine-DL-glutamate epimerase-like enolase superfamily enzyme